MATSCELAWCAGLFDGEGCVFIAKQVRRNRPTCDYSLRLTMSMVHRPTLERFCGIIGAGRVVPHRAGIRKHRDSWQVIVCGAHAIRVLRLLRRFLVTKAAEADLALKFQERPRTRYPKGGRPAHVAEALESMRHELMHAKRYEWKHGEVSQ